MRKALQLLLGLVFAGGTCSSAHAGLTGRAGPAGVHLVFVGLHAAFAVRLLCAALAGDRGLLGDVPRRAALDAAREDRRLAPEDRPARVTHPSHALRERGAAPRVRRLAAR
ncbi:hypothetical protein GobsT_63510 [Gemmata obscuriglobus]|uniref:Uncharacterized protein n=1 Tax=Gemmata obscuriglobus TaxID=114 RepID=A0A2Z3GWH1_9BACT|nr:hypothetical protein [Gemmata obscuriglobus]AWM35917.1 hypothetical protein C1280_02080 [Gemmata obscuriglobus]QEG31529.1 hypothetical protein GobsT_63510 [Gemmata obscuriglobus]VTS10871.1 unnamed protein product [Gemmata obscuriglobus UQM 2246]